RDTLKRFKIVAADIERERLGKAFWCELDVFIAVILARVAAALFGEQLVQDLQPLIHHVATTGTLDAVAAPGSKFLAICTKTHRHDEAALGDLVERDRLLGKIDRLA